MTEPTGTFDDGSGGDNYADDQNNWIRVSPCEADAIPCQVLLYFSEFDVTGGDYLYIHDGVEDQRTLSKGRGYKTNIEAIEEKTREH